MEGIAQSTTRRLASSPSHADTGRARQRQKRCYTKVDPTSQKISAFLHFVRDDGCCSALNMDSASTNHSAYHICVDRRNKNNTARRSRNCNLPNLSVSQKRIFTSKLRRALTDGTPVVTFLDEVSMCTAITLGHIIQRYREVENLIIGPFILVGDFFQVFRYNLFCFRFRLTVLYFSDQACRGHDNLLLNDAL